jgi:hypothetical protein
MRTSGEPLPMSPTVVLYLSGACSLSPKARRGGRHAALAWLWPSCGHADHSTRCVKLLVDLRACGHDPSPGMRALVCSESLAHFLRVPASRR